MSIWRIRSLCPSIALGILFAYGCGSDYSPQPVASAPATNPQTDTKSASSTTATTTATPTAPPVQPPSSTVVAEQEDEPAAEEATTDDGDESVRQKAEVGVGRRGSRYGGGVISEPVRVYFRAKERIAFMIQIPDALRLYKAEKGEGPQTHEEFMEQIIKPNAIQLPDLPDGHHYMFDPEAQELMVERPQP